MAKIRKVDILPKFKGDEGKEIPEHTVWETHLMYSPKSKLFYIAAPEEWKDFKPTNPEIAELMGGISVRSIHTREPALVGEIEKAVIEKAELYFGAFLLEKPQITKVILYIFKYSRGKDSNHYEHERLDEVSLDFIICERQEYGSLVTYTQPYTYGGPMNNEYTGQHDYTHYVEGGNPRGDRQFGYSDGKYRWMEWTQEREDYFTNLREGMRNLIELMVRVTGDSDSFQALIDTGGANLLGTGKTNIGESDEHD